VAPPQLARLARELGMPKTPTNQDEFLDLYQRWIKD
jgi:hypothetical protein